MKIPEGVSEKIRAVLLAKGHTLKPDPLTVMSPKIMAVEKTNDDVHAWADKRALGGPAAQF